MVYSAWTNRHVGDADDGARSLFAVMLDLSGPQPVVP